MASKSVIAISTDEQVVFPGKVGACIVPADLGARIDALSRTHFYRGARHECSTVGYGVGCEEGRRRGIAFVTCLLSGAHPEEFGGALQHVVFDASRGIGKSNDIEAAYRKGWIVGFCRQIEDTLYEGGRHE